MAQERSVGFHSDEGQAILEGWAEYLVSLGKEGGLGADANRAPTDTDVVFYTQAGWVRVRIVAACDASTDERVYVP